MISTSVAIGLSLLNLLVWGTWPTVRVRCKCDGVVFIPLYMAGQLGTAMVLSLLIDAPGTVQAFLQLQPSIGLLCLLVGGFIVGHGDFLCSCAMSYLPTSIAFPIYTGLMMVLGTLMSYFVEGCVGSAWLLALGDTLALGAVLSLAGADMVASHSAARSHCTTPTDMPPAGPLMPEGESADNMVVILLADQDLPAEDEQDLPPSSRQVGPGDASGCCTESTAACGSFDREPPGEAGSAAAGAGGHAVRVERLPGAANPFVLVCAFAGSIGSLWSPLSSLGRQAGGVEQPYAALVLFIAAQASGVPLMLYYGTRLVRPPAPPACTQAAEPGEDFRGAEGASVMATVASRLRETWALPREDKVYAVLAGSLVGAGYTLYFTSSDVLSPTIAVAIASCEPLAGIVLGVVVDSQLRRAPLAQRGLMGAAVLLFVAAIVSFAAMQ